MRRLVPPLSLLLLMLVPGAAGRLPAATDLARAFEEANRLYEQAKFAEAAANYQRLIDGGHHSAALYYNLGNAWFKSGQNGRAIAAYRQAQELTPRDPNLRFNLQFVRKRISGDEREYRSGWDWLIGTVTLNEWTLLAMGSYWALCLVLAGRELWPFLRAALRPYALGAGVLTVLFLGCLVAAYMHRRANDAVVIVPNAVVRRSPLEESDVAHQLPDGSEVTVLDAKESSDGKQLWLQVQGQRGTGWVQRDQVILLRSPAPRETVISSS